LPPLKPKTACIASRTIWIGNLQKNLATEENIRQMISRASDIEDMTVIVSRGCAYIVMKSRPSAFKTLAELHRERRREERRKVDWAVNKGIKDNDLVDYFDKVEGAAYIPYDKLSDSVEVIQNMADGGLIDIESLPEKLKPDDICSQMATL
jgi:RNA recognition motif-containing protein